METDSDMADYPMPYDETTKGVSVKRNKSLKVNRKKTLIKKYDLAEMFKESVHTNYKVESRINFQFDTNTIAEERPGYRLATRKAGCFTLEEEASTREREQEVL